MVDQLSMSKFIKLQKTHLYPRMDVCVKEIPGRTDIQGKFLSPAQFVGRGIKTTK